MKKKMSKIELFFNIFSVFFLTIFIILYGYRMIYYKNKLAPKINNGSPVTMLSNKVKEKVTKNGNGLYNEDSNYVFKGTDVNNYVMYSNMLFRIIKVNRDNTIEMILNEPLNYMSYDNKIINYNESNLKKYLNEVFYNNIKSDLLVSSPYCCDIVENVGKGACNNIKTDYIKLLSITDYLNSKIDDKSYIDDNSITWLNDNNNENVWLINNGNLSLEKPNELYQVKPVITLSNLAMLKGGSGTIEDPYLIENDNSYFASYIKLDNDLYRVYSINDNILKLQLDELYQSGNIKYQYSNTYDNYNLLDGIGNYLNNDIYNELSYKDLLSECEFYIGDYEESYEDVLKTNINAKIGISNIIDPIFNYKKNNYYLSTMSDNNVYIYNDGVYLVKPNIVRNISMSVCIDKNKISSGNGTFDSPYILRNEVR